MTVGLLRGGVLLLLLGLLGCGVTQGREPSLTNPPRTAAWSGLAGGGEGSEAFDKYAGRLRLPLSEDWTFTLPDAGHWELARMEAGSALVRDEHVLIGSSRQPGVSVIGRTDGLLRRTIPTPGPVQAAPLTLADGGLLLVDTFGVIQRLDADLKPLWEYRSGGAVQRGAVLADDLVLVGLADDSVLAVGLEDGAWRWSFRRDVARGSQELAIQGAPAPLVVDETVYAGFSDGALVALDLRSGAQRWSAQVSGGKFPDIQADAVLHEDRVLVAGFAGPLVALDRTTGRELWRLEEVGAAWPMQLDLDTLYVADSDGSLHAVDPAHGTIQWTWQVPDTPLLALFRGEPEEQRGGQDVSTLEGARRAARQAREAAEAAGEPAPRPAKGPGPKPGAQLGAPAVAGGQVLVGELGGTLYAIDRYEGTESWRYRPSDGTVVAGTAAAPTVAGRQVLVPTSGGRLLSLISDSALTDDDTEEPAHRRDRPLNW